MSNGYLHVCTQQHNFGRQYDDTDLHMHRYPLVCWQSCGKVQVQPVELPGSSRSPLLYLWTVNNTNRKVTAAVTQGKGRKDTGVGIDFYNRS